MMISIVTHLLQIVVFTGHPQTFLSIAYTWRGGLAGSQEVVLELVHARIGKHQGRIILQNHGCGGENLVVLLLEKF